MSKIQHYRFIIKGFHPESDSEWIEDESSDTAEEAWEYMYSLPEIDYGHGYYTVFDTKLNKEVKFTDLKNYEELLKIKRF